MIGVMMNTRVTRMMAVVLLMVVFLGALGITMLSQAKADVFDFDDIVKVSEAPGGTPTVSVGDGVSDELNAGGLVGKAKGIAQIILGICTVISLAMLIINIAKLATSSANEAGRKKAQTGILWSGIALGLFGGLSILVGFFWNFFISF